MKKAIAAVSLCVALTLCMSLSAFADDVYNINGDVYLHEAYVRYQTSSTTFDWMKKTDLTWGPIPGNTAWIARFGKDLVNSPYLGFRLIFEPYANETSVKVPAGYYISLSIGGNDVSYIGSNQGLTDYYFNAWVTDKLGEVYVSRTTPSYYNEGSQWFANLFFHVGSGDKDAEITEIVIESNFPSGSYGNNYYDINITMTATHIPTADQRNHEETIDAIGDASDQISGSIDDAADNIINDNLGYQEDPDQADAKNGIQAIKVKIDSLSDDIDESVDDFSASIDGLKTSINSGKSFVWGWLDYVPVWVTAIIVGFAGILIARKVVK